MKNKEDYDHKKTKKIIKSFWDEIFTHNKKSELESLGQGKIRMLEKL